MYFHWHKNENNYFLSNIYRYSEQPVMTKNEVLDSIKDNEYIITILKILNQICPDYFFTILPSGSIREGFGKSLPSTCVLGSDYDLMLVPDAIPVAERLDSWSVDVIRGENPVFSVHDTPDSHIPFVWLRLENSNLTQWKDVCIPRQRNGVVHYFLSTCKIHQLIRNAILNNSYYLQMLALSKLGDRDALEIFWEQAGPAFNIKIKTLEHNCLCTTCPRYLQCCEIKRNEFDCDFTVSLHCPQWPEIAEGKFFSLSYLFVIHSGFYRKS